MPLATKNNAIIVKDGSIAEGCGCCGGWYCVQCANCDQTCSPLAPGPQSATIAVTLSNITPTFAGAEKKNSGGQWLEFLDAFPSSSRGVEIPLYLDWKGNPAYSNNLSGSGEIVIQLITTKTYNLSGNDREFPPSEFGYMSGKRCLYRHEYFTTSYEVRKPATNSGVLVPAYSVSWQINDCVYVSVQGAITGAINFTPPGISQSAWADPRFVTSEERETAGGFYFTASFPYQGVPDAKTFNAQTSPNLFASTVAGTTYDWSYDITVSMK